MNDLSPKEQYEREKAQKEAKKDRHARKRTAKKALWWGIGIVIVVAGIYGLIQLGGGDGGAGVTALPQDRVAEDEWTKGNPEASVVLIEYSDFQCPACRAAEPFVRQLTEEFDDEMTFVYRHFPLRSIHGDAAAAARASEAAGMQGKFWEMHDMLFARQEEWVNGDAEDLFVSYADLLELDVARFEQDLESDAVEDAVAQDELSARAAGVNATPTFVLNGQRITNIRSFDDLRTAVQAAIQSGGGGQ